ncbi:hypothetical protein NFI96_012909, partial [Prochilodus magdalenae]
MEMMEDIYANTEVITDHRRSADTGGPSYEDIYTNEDNTEMCKTRNKQTSYGTETAGEVEDTSPSHTADPQYRGTSTESRRCLRVTAVCLGLLCVLLLTAITVLCIKLNNLTVERDQLQPNCTSLAVERDQLQTRFTNLEFSYMEAVNERDQLKEKLRSAAAVGCTAVSMAPDTHNKPRRTFRSHSQPGLHKVAVHYCSRAQRLSSSTKLTCRVTFIRVTKVNISQSRMEMINDIYAHTGVITDHRRSADSGGPSYEDIYTNEDNTEMCKTRNKQRSSGTVTAGEVEETSPSHTADPQYRESYTASRGCRRLAAVCLGLLCVLLLTAIIVLWIKLSNMTIERDRLQTSYTSLTKERDQLQTSYTSLTTERDQLQTSYTNLTKERDQLQTSFTNLTIERDQLQTSFTNLAVERDRLQTSYTKLTVERDQLQTRFTNLESSYMEVVNERDQLKKKPCSA